MLYYKVYQGRYTYCLPVGNLYFEGFTHINMESFIKRRKELEKNVIYLYLFEQQSGRAP